MRQLVWIAAIGVFLGLSSAPAAATPAYPGAGDPDDVSSCFSHCDRSAPPAVSVCYCDRGCEARGDCCADRPEFCAPETVKPACAVTSNSGFSNFCGTDLGFVYQHGPDLEVLFGDTWEKATGQTTCHDRGEDYVTGDDSQGRLPVTRPTAAQGVPTRAFNLPGTPGGNCGSFLNLDRTPTSGSPYTFTTVTLHSTTGANLQMPPGDTPLAGFSDGTNAWGMFKQGGHVYIAYRESSARTNYKVRVDLGTNSNFLNPSVARITNWASILSNFDTPTGTGGSLFFFGRPRFWSVDSENASDNGVYMMRQDQPISTSGASTWAPWYLTGVNPAGVPTWSIDATKAIPIPGTKEDFKVSEQIDIKWVPEMKKWVMLYGGDMEWYLAPPVNDQPRHGAIHMRTADFPWGPWTRPTPLLWRESLGSYIKCDASDLTNPAGCDWEVYDPGTWKHSQSSTVNGCITGLPEPVMFNFFGVPPDTVSCGYFGFYSPHQRGEMYAAELLPTWTNPGTYDTTARTNLTTLYFLVSTWMPYQVIVAAADIRLPVQDYSTGVKVQLRDLNNDMIRTGQLNVSMTAGGSGGGETSFYVQRVDGSTPKNGPRIGDQVVIRTGQTGNASPKYLAHNGIGSPIWVPYVSGGAIPASAKWKLQSTDPFVYIDSSPIVWGKTPFHIVDAGDNTAYLKSKPDQLHVYHGNGEESIWHFSWSCQPGDTCL